MSLIKRLNKISSLTESTLSIRECAEEMVSAIIHDDDSKNGSLEWLTNLINAKDSMMDGLNRGMVSSICKKLGAELPEEIATEEAEEQ